MISRSDKNNSFYGEPDSSDSLNLPNVMIYIPNNMTYIHKISSTNSI
jgi:hypothetical protein